MPPPRSIATVEKKQWTQTGTSENSLALEDL